MFPVCPGTSHACGVSVSCVQSSRMRVYVTFGYFLLLTCLISIGPLDQPRESLESRTTFLSPPQLSPSESRRHDRSSDPMPPLHRFKCQLRALCWAFSGIFYFELHKPRIVSAFQILTQAKESQGVPNADTFCPSVLALMSRNTVRNCMKSRG